MSEKCAIIAKTILLIGVISFIGIVEGYPMNGLICLVVRDSNLNCIIFAGLTNRSVSKATIVTTLIKCTGSFNIQILNLDGRPGSLDSIGEAKESSKRSCGKQDCLPYFNFDKTCSTSKSTDVPVVVKTNGTIKESGAPGGTPSPDEDPGNYKIPVAVIIPIFTIIAVAVMGQYVYRRFVKKKNKEEPSRNRSKTPSLSSDGENPQDTNEMKDNASGNASESHSLLSGDSMIYEEPGLSKVCRDEDPRHHRHIADEQGSSGNTPTVSTSPGAGLSVQESSNRWDINAELESSGREIST